MHTTPARIFRLSYRDVIIAAEAAALLIRVELALRRVSLDTLVARFARANRADRGGREAIDVARAARLVDAVAACYPLNATCLKKSLVLFRILRKRGIPAELRLGVKTLEDNFSAHAWIECEGRTLLDGGIAHLYTTLPLTPDVREPRAAPAARNA